MAEEGFISLPSCLDCSGALPVSSELKLPTGKANHSSLFSSEVKNAWSYASTPACVFTAWCLKAQGQHYIYLAAEPTHVRMGRRVATLLTFKPSPRPVSECIHSEIMGNWGSDVDIT